MFNRVFYDKNTRKIIYQHFMEDPEVVTDFAILEIPAGEIDYDTHYIESVDSNGKPVVAMRDLSPKDSEIKSLKEDIILLQVDSSEGGIL